MTVSGLTDMNFYHHLAFQLSHTIYNKIKTRRNKGKGKESSELLRGLCLPSKTELLRDRLWYTDSSSS